MKKIQLKEKQGPNGWLILIKEWKNYLFPVVNDPEFYYRLLA
jgi:hypothetical protein